VVSFLRAVPRQADSVGHAFTESSLLAYNNRPNRRTIITQIQQAIHISGRSSSVLRPVTAVLGGLTTAITARRTRTRIDQHVPFDVELHVVPPFGTFVARSF
jgi:hypothetical protein